MGVLAVEMFLAGDRVLVNEVAARPHNSGHWTIDGSVTSQFENHLRAVLDLPLGDTSSTAAHTVSVNVLGGSEGYDPRDFLADALEVVGAHVHLYGKVARPGRKLGHVTVCGTDPDDVRHRAWDAATALGTPGVTSEGGQRPMTQAHTPDFPPAPGPVGVVMGSASDLAVMEGAVEVLTKFDVHHEVRVLSAHRTPDDMLEYGHRAAERGLRVLIAGAGGAAHLPGMLAAATTLPVIGVPVSLATMSGLDSLLSIVQMPRGVPVATVAINGARNAAFLALRDPGAGRPRPRQEDAPVPAPAGRRGARPRRVARAGGSTRGRLAGSAVAGRSSRPRPVVGRQVAGRYRHGVTLLVERLGYPPDAKVAILHAGDLGLCHAANVGVFDTLRGGLATSAALMVPGPWAREAAARYRGEDVGVQLTLNATLELYRWGPITQAPSLLGGDGGFPRTMDDVWDHADLDEVRRECRAQIERAIVWGFDVSHLDTHLATLQLRPEFFDVYLELAVEFGLPIRLLGSRETTVLGFPARQLAEEAGVIVTDDVVAVAGES